MHWSFLLPFAVLKVERDVKIGGELQINAAIEVIEISGPLAVQR